MVKVYTENKEERVGIQDMLYYRRHKRGFLVRQQRPDHGAQLQPKRVQRRRFFDLAGKWAKSLSLEERRFLTELAFKTKKAHTWYNMASYLALVEPTVGFTILAGDTRNEDFDQNPCPPWEWDEEEGSGFECSYHEEVGAFDVLTIQDGTWGFLRYPLEFEVTDSDDVEFWLDVQPIEQSGSNAHTHMGCFRLVDTQNHTNNNRLLIGTHYNQYGQAGILFDGAGNEHCTSNSVPTWNNRYWLRFVYLSDTREFFMQRWDETKNSLLWESSHPTLPEDAHFVVDSFGFVNRIQSLGRWRRWWFYACDWVKPEGALLVEEGVNQFVVSQPAIRRVKAMLGDDVLYDSGELSNLATETLISRHEFELDKKPSHLLIQSLAGFWFTKYV